VYNLRTGVLEAILAKPNPAVGDGFGFSVAISGNTIVVGASGTGAGPAKPGTAYVFDAHTGTLLQTLANPTPVNGEQFGSAVAIDGDTVVVGSSNALVSGTPAGEAYIFSAQTGELAATLTNPAPVSFGNFGSSVSVSDGRVLVGAPGSSFFGTNVP